MPAHACADPVIRDGGRDTVSSEPRDGPSIPDDKANSLARSPGYARSEKTNALTLSNLAAASGWMKLGVVSALNRP